MTERTYESGWVVRLQSGFYSVQTEKGVVVCGIRGKLKKVDAHGDFIALGDRVKITRLDGKSGIIEELFPRTNCLSRTDPTPGGNFRQIMLANIDQIVLVFACAEPEPHLKMLDRFLVIAEKEQIPAVIVANKVELVGEEKAARLFGIYKKLGYPLLFTSAATQQGIPALEQQLLEKISGLAGPSGVGKSSLLNLIQPQLGLKVGKVKEVTAKGKHTTNVREMFSLDGGGFVADLPGLRTISLWDTQPEELDGYFRELRELVNLCQFNDCTHRSEPGCAIRAAVAAGTVDAERYDSYLRLRFGG